METRQVDSRRWLFRSHSTDFRFHESVLLRAEPLRDYESFGPIAGVVGIVVGFGSNFFNGDPRRQPAAVAQPGMCAA